MAADPSVEASISFRDARPSDAEALANLTTQLGYPVTVAELAERLASLDTRDGAVIVAEMRDDRDAARVVGWVHVRILVLLTGAHAEIDGLVVDEEYRGQRIGEDLLSRAEQWAVERGQQRIYVRSNVIRERAHRFYEGLDYERVKTSYTFVKEVDMSARTV